MHDEEQGPENMTVAEPFDKLVERWWEDHFPGSAVARDTQAWNIAHAAKETLKRLLVQARDKFSKGSV